ncbi:MAG TPA: hypothetical protein VE398_01710, partial [Acidobacteriota bacterium]|nr:hypothetical protein [Acidobacteriota bacterium]
QLQPSSWNRSTLLFVLLLPLSHSTSVQFQVASAAQSEREVRTDSPVRQFENSLRNLDLSRKQSILAARQEFLKTYSAVRPEVQADAFRLFLAFYRDAIRICDDEFCRREDLQRVLRLVADETGSYDSPLSALAKSSSPAASELKTNYHRELKQLEEYRECGMDFRNSEGDWYLNEDLDFLLNLAASLSGEYRDYMLFHIEESRQRIVEDAALLISWEDLGRRIAHWERFAVCHPSLPETRTVIGPGIQTMMSWYLLGLDNTRAYDFSNKGAIDSKLYQSYGTFLERNSQSRYFELLSRVHASLKESQCRMNQKLLDMLKSAGYRDSHLEREVARLVSTTPP